MSQFISLLVVISWLLLEQAGPQPLPPTLQQEAYKAMEASVQGDYTTLLTYTYPRLIDVVGGSKKMLALMKRQRPPRHSEVIIIRIEKPGTIYKAGQELHVLVPYVLTIHQKTKWVRIREYQLAVSRNQGKHWYFVPTDQLTAANIHLLFTAFNPGLKIPPHSKQILIDQQ